MTFSTKIQSPQKTEIIPDEPFTNLIVYEILLSVLKGSQRVPGHSSTEVTNLTHILNHIRGLARYRANEFREHEQACKRAKEAVSALTEILPTLRLEYVNSLRAAEKWGAKMERFGIHGAELGARSNLESLDALLNAAWSFRQLGHPHHSPATLGIEADRWTGYARHLMRAFAATTDVQSKETGYRFIAAVTPRITGESPSFEAVKTEIKREREVNRGKSGT